MKATLFCSMDVGPRPNQQDAVLAAGRVYQENDVTASWEFAGHIITLEVCDGLGGHSAGEEASRYVCDKLAGAFSGGYPGPAEVDAAVAEIQASMKEGVVPFDSGTTVAALVTDGRRVMVVNAGDSRVYRVSEAGLVRVSHDHSFVQRLVDDKLLTEADAFSNPFRNLVDFGVGPIFADRWDARQPLYIFEEDCGPGATYLLCSDGVSDVLTDARMAEVLAADPLGRARELTAAIRAAGMKDNASIVMARMEQAEE